MREITPPPTKTEGFTFGWKNWLYQFYQTVKNWEISGEPFYEEGTWTPVLSDGTNDATSSVAVGDYTKVGRQVSFTGRLTTTSLGSVSGSLRITGLPYTAQNVANSQASISVGYGNGLAITAGESVSALVIENTTRIDLYVWDAATGATNMQETEWTADGDLIFGGFYYI